MQNTFCWNQILNKFHISSNNLSCKRDITYKSSIEYLLSALPLCLVSRAFSTQNNCQFRILEPLNSSKVVEHLNYVDLWDLWDIAEIDSLWGNYWSNSWGVFWSGFWCDLLEDFWMIFWSILTARILSAIITGDESTERVEKNNLKKKTH